MYDMFVFEFNYKIILIINYKIILMNYQNSIYKIKQIRQICGYILTLLFNLEDLE